jgi:hypothetical protein
MGRKMIRVEIGLAEWMGGDAIPAFRISAERKARGGQFQRDQEAERVVEVLYHCLPAETLHRIFARIRHRLGLCTALDPTGTSATCCAPVKQKRRRSR